MALKQFDSMTSPSEHRTVQAHIFAYVQDTGWRCARRSEVEKQRSVGLSKVQAVLE